MNEESILQFLSEPIEDLTLDELTDRLANLLAAFDFDFFVVVHVSRPGSPIDEYVMTGRYETAWKEIYAEKDYYKYDPVALYVRRCQQPFRWRHAVEQFAAAANADKMHSMVQDAESHGLKEGYVFPVHGDRGLIGYISAGGRPRELTAPETMLLEAVAKRVFWATLHLCKPQMANTLTSLADIQMTRRELEVLNHLADGMTSNDIGAVLGISNNTVDWYMNGIQDKLKARNRHHAVAISFRLGLLS